MKRSELTEKLLDFKREKGWSWKHICDEIGGHSEVLIVGAILGQMKLTRPQAANAAKLFGLSKVEQAMINEVPMRGGGIDRPIRSSIGLMSWSWSTARHGRRLSRRSSETGSCRRSISTWSWSVMPIRRRSAQDHDVWQVPAVQVLRSERK
jgi:hypothetical protein